MYDHSSLLIAGILFVSMLLAIEAGYRVGLRGWGSASEWSKNHVNTLQASLLGVLALLLGFTFSLALQRYDNRSVAVVDEANAIGTALLRAQLLPDAVRADAQRTLKEYLALRVRASAVNLAAEEERLEVIAAGMRKLDTLWGHARHAAELDGSPVRTGLFIEALNDVIDSHARRDAALKRHVPEVVLFLLYGTFLMTGSIVGYAAGIAGHRTSFATYIMVTLIVLLVFIIIDLDRPRRGLIQVSQESLVELQAATARQP
jgi:hypothetical protein